MSIDTLLLSVLFIVSVLAFFGGARPQAAAVEPISTTVLDAVYDDPTPELPTLSPIPDPWKPSFVDAVVPFTRPVKRSLNLAALSAAEIRELCSKHQIPCPGRGRIGKHILSQLAEVAA